MRIPGQILVEIDETLLPAGPQGEPGPPGGAIKQRVCSRMSVLPTIETQSTSFVSCGLSASITPTAPNKIKVRAIALVGHSLTNAIVHFSLKKNGTDVPVDGCSGLSAVRVPGPSDVSFMHLEYEDVASSTDPVTYELTWKVHDGIGYLGRRWDDLTIKVKPLLELEEYS